jgi:hypothetical protein
VEGRLPPRSGSISFVFSPLSAIKTELGNLTTH